MCFVVIFVMEENEIWDVWMVVYKFIKFDMIVV